MLEGAGLHALYLSLDMPRLPVVSRQTSSAPRAPFPGGPPVAKKTSKAVKNSTVALVAEPKKKVAAAKQVSPSYSNESIGQVAGEIWSALSENGGMTIASLKKLVAGPGDLVVAGLGWLAREGKLEFATNGRTLKVSLR